jgi:hypothetical protein
MANRLKDKEYPKTWNCINCNKEHPFKGYSFTHKFCDNTCQREYQSKERTRQWLEEGKDWTAQVPEWAKRHLASLHGNKCSVCDLEKWLGKKIVLEVDHIDGLHYNNTVENLRLICPNCHSQTETYKNKNKGKGRKYRRAA